MTQDEINKNEWKNPDNWSGPGFYFSKKDSRIWVPKSTPWMGWTLNIARPMGAYLLLAFILLFCALLSGCNTPVMHPWQMSGDDRWVTIETGKWPVVSQDLYVAVPEAAIRNAEKLLLARDCVELSVDQEAEFNHHLKRPVAPNLKPYLIRGVTMGSPFFSVVRRNPTTNEILVYRATWDGEISIPFVHPKFGIWPIVIYLETPPMRVYPTAVLGGDWIMRGQTERDTRLLERKTKGGDRGSPIKVPGKFGYQPDGKWTSSHQMTLNGKRSGFALEDFKACANSASMKRGRAETIIAEVRNVVARWRDYADESRVHSEQRDKIQTALRLEPLT